MKNPNLACDIFKILLEEHISSFSTEDDCFTNKPERYLDKYAIDKLITSSFSISDQLLDRISADPEWKKIQAEAKAKQQQCAPKPVPQPIKAKPKKA